MAKFITKKGGSHNVSFGKGKLVKKSTGVHKPASSPQQEVLKGQMVQPPTATQQGFASQEPAAAFLLKCQSCGVVGEMEEYIDEFECPNCRGIMLPATPAVPRPQDITQTQKADITQLIDEALPDMEEFDELEDNTPTIAISKEQISEYKKNIKVAKPVDVGMFSSGSTSVSLQVPTKSASASAPIDAAKIRAQQELESKVRREAEAAERKKIEESILTRQVEDQRRLEEKRRLDDQQRREDELIKKFREEEERKRLEEEKVRNATVADSELSERLAAQAERLRQEKDEFEKQKTLYEKNRLEQEAYFKVKREKDELEKQNALRSLKENEEKIRREKDELEKQKKDLDLISRRVKEEEELVKLRREKDELEKQKKAFEDAEKARKTKEEEDARIKGEWLKIEEQKKALNNESVKFEEEKKMFDEDKKKLEEGRKALEDDRKKLADEKKAFEEKKTAFENDKKKFEEDKKKFEEDKKKFEEDKKKSGPSSMAENIAKPLSGEKKEIIDLSGDKKDGDKKEDADKKDDDKKDGDKKDSDKKDDDKKDGDKKKSGVKKSGIPGKSGKGPMGQRPGGVKKKDASGDAKDSPENPEGKKDLPDFLTQTNIMRLQATKKKKIMIIIGIGVVLVIIAIYALMMGGTKLLKAKRTNGSSAKPAVVAPPAVTPVKKPVAAPEPVDQPVDPVIEEAKTSAEEEKTPAVPLEPVKKVYAELSKKLKDQPSSIVQINEYVKLLKEFVEKYEGTSGSEVYLEKARGRIQALEASKDLY